MDCFPPEALPTPLVEVEVDRAALISTHVIIGVHRDFQEVLTKETEPFMIILRVTHYDEHHRTRSYGSQQMPAVMHVTGAGPCRTIACLHLGPCL